MKSKPVFRIVLIVALMAMFAMLLVMQGSAGATGTSRVAFINVGQGDSILLQDGNGFDVLIDGGQPAAGPTVVAYLRAQGVSDIDVMVNTHPDSDHVGGLIDVLQLADIPVKAVVFNGYSGTTTTWNNFATAVANEGLQLTPAQYPVTYTWGAMTVNVLNPEPGLPNPETNNASIVLSVKQGNIGYLFTGDIDSTQEANIVAHGTSVAADILKVPHHGSMYSSGAAFLAAVNPKDAVISVGPNSYGHPAADTLARLTAAGAHIWRTDLAGNVVVLSDGITYTISGDTQLVYLPLVIKQVGSVTPTPTATVTPTETIVVPVSDLRITTLSGTTAPEYVTIQNFGTAAQDLTGWTLVSVVGPQTFNFPAGYVLNAGATVSIQSYTGATNNPPAILLWSSGAIWNNAGDKAELRNASSGVVSSMCYASGCP